MTPRRTIFSATLAVCVAASSARAAGPEDTANAQVLFDQAMKFMGSSNFAAACPKFEESLQLDPALGTLYRLAECYEKAGRTASAWARYTELADKSRVQGQNDRAKFASDRAAALEPTLVRIVIDVPSDRRVKGLKITRGRVAVTPELWGTEVPVDPGQIDIVATAPGYRSWSTRITASKAGTVRVEIPALRPGESGGAEDEGDKSWGSVIAKGRNQEASGDTPEERKERLKTDPKFRAEQERKAKAERERKQALAKKAFDERRGVHIGPHAGFAFGSIEVTHKVPAPIDDDVKFTSDEPSAMLGAGGWIPLGTTVDLALHVLGYLPLGEPEAEWACASDTYSYDKYSGCNTPQVSGESVSPGPINNVAVAAASADASLRIRDYGSGFYGGGGIGLAIPFLWAKVTRDAESPKRSSTLTATPAPGVFGLAEIGFQPAKVPHLDVGARWVVGDLPTVQFLAGWAF